jgi:hypothetical protein
MDQERAVGVKAVAADTVTGALGVVLAGPTIYEGPTAFIDIDRLLRTLEADAVTGHVRVEGPGFRALVLLVVGRIVAARFADDRVGELGGRDEVLRYLGWRAGRGDGRVTVVDLDDDRAEAATELLTGHPLVAGLRGRFADLDGLLDYLGEVAADATLVVEGGGGTAVVLFDSGRVRRTFVGERSILGRLPTAVRALATDPLARIEIVADAHWVPGRPPAKLPALVLQGRRSERPRRRSPRTAAGGGAA